MAQNKCITPVEGVTSALLDSAQRFRTIFERANAGIAFADCCGNILDFNNAFAQLLEYEHDELLGLNFARYTHPDDVAVEVALSTKSLPTSVMATAWKKVCHTLRQNHLG